MVDVVVLNDWESVREALSKDEFLGRPQQTIFNAYTEDVSFAFLEDDEWREQRRFAMRTLKDLGFAKALMENQIAESINELCDYIEKQNREPKKMLTWIHGTSLNVVLEFFAGKRYSFDDEEFSKILHTAVASEESTTLVDIAAYYPSLAKIFAKYQILGFDKFKELVDLLIDFSEKRVQEVENQLDTENKSYITEFLAEIASNEQNGKQSSFN
ncbi:Cytochrome P450 18a1-like protein, partial [Leptotrombidium deliense]